MKAINSFEDRIKNSSLGLINFEVLIKNPSEIYNVWNQYLFNPAFRLLVESKYNTDILFRLKFDEYFSRFYDEKSLKLK